VFHGLLEAHLGGPGDGTCSWQLQCYFLVIVIPLILPSENGSRKEKRGLSNAGFPGCRFQDAHARGRFRSAQPGTAMVQNESSLVLQLQTFPCRATLWGFSLKLQWSQTLSDRQPLKTTKNEAPGVNHSSNQEKGLTPAWLPLSVLRQGNEIGWDQ
jgi:hypothetical protein